MTSAVHWTTKACATARLGMGRTAIATVLEGAVKVIASIARQHQGIGTLGAAVRNWVRFDTLFFLPTAMQIWYAGTEAKFNGINSVAYGLDGVRDLAQWTLRHAQVPFKGNHIENGFNLVERLACAGLLVSNVFGIDKDITVLNRAEIPDRYRECSDAYKKSMRLQIAMKGCVVADASLRLIAKDFRWYSTADTCIRVAAAVCLLLYLWIDPTSPAHTGAVFSTDGPGGGSGKGTKKV